MKPIQFSDSEIAILEQTKNIITKYKIKYIQIYKTKIIFKKKGKKFRLEVESEELCLDNDKDVQTEDEEKSEKESDNRFELFPDNNEVISDIENEICNTDIDEVNDKEVEFNDTDKVVEKGDNEIDLNNFNRTEDEKKSEEKSDNGFELFLDNNEKISDIENEISNTDIDEVTDKGVEFNDADEEVEKSDNETELNNFNQTEDEREKAPNSSDNSTETFVINIDRGISDSFRQRLRLINRNSKRKSFNDGRVIRNKRSKQVDSDAEKSNNDDDDYMNVDSSETVNMDAEKTNSEKLNEQAPNNSDTNNQVIINPISNVNKDSDIVMIDESDEKLDKEKATNNSVVVYEGVNSYTFGSNNYNLNEFLGYLDRNQNVALTDIELNNQFDNLYVSNDYQILDNDFIQPESESNYIKRLRKDDELMNLILALRNPVYRNPLNDVYLEMTTFSKIIENCITAEIRFEAKNCELLQHYYRTGAFLNKIQEDLKDELSLYPDKSIVTGMLKGTGITSSYLDRYKDSYDKAAIQKKALRMYNISIRIFKIYSCFPNPRYQIFRAVEKVSPDAFTKIGGGNQSAFEGFVKDIQKAISNNYEYYHDNNDVIESYDFGLITEEIKKDVMIYVKNPSLSV